RRNRLFIELRSEEVAESRPPHPQLEAFYQNEVRAVLEGDDPSWGWIFTDRARQPIPENRVEALRMVVGPGQARIVDGLMSWVERKRRLDLEFWLDGRANCWLRVHGWASAVLLALVIDHVIGSVRLGGW